MKFMRKVFLMSIMLMGLVSLFTSCVDGDYYDLYDDEEEISSPRSKKGKDAPGDVSGYPLMNSDWQEAECVACCYSNIYGVDKPTARCVVITAQYGSFNDESYRQYFALSGASTRSTVYKIFGTNEKEAGSFAKDCVEHNSGGTLTFSKLAVLTPDHIAKVTGVHVYNISSGGYVVYVDIIDQFGNRPSAYNVVLDSRKRLVSSSCESFLFCK